MTTSNQEKTSKQLKSKFKSIKNHLKIKKIIKTQGSRARQARARRARELDSIAINIDQYWLICDYFDQSDQYWSILTKY